MRDEPLPLAYSPGDTLMSRREHWDRVYGTSVGNSLSWFQAVPEVSLQLLEHAGLSPDT
jgi:hypothetical protein